MKNQGRLAIGVRILERQKKITYFFSVIIINKYLLIRLVLVAKVLQMMKFDYENNQKELYFFGVFVSYTTYR